VEDSFLDQHLGEKHTQGESIAQRSQRGGWAVAGLMSRIRLALAESKTAPLESAVLYWPLQREQLLATATDFIEMSEQVGGIFVNPRRARALKFLLSEAAGQ
jgi:hypothetical protein